jgi:NAD(P)-dependent dehydrogenase (short-subunit alcohol dehydrogenase family)
VVFPDFSINLLKPVVRRSLALPIRRGHRVNSLDESEPEMNENSITRKVIVTGASSGIGRATALRFLSNGDNVALVGRREGALQNVVSPEASAGNAFIIAADLSDEKQTERCVAQAVEMMGGLDVLVNAAGILKAGRIEDTTFELWDEMMNINLRSVFHLMQLAVPHLEPSRGNIVNVSSVTGPRSFPGVLAYCVSKAAVDQLTRCAALELAPKGIRVNEVNPGVVVTELHRAGGMNDEAYAAFLEHCKTTHPLGRVGQPEEIADLIYFLASDRAGWITGATVSIDGGRALTCAR